MSEKTNIAWCDSTVNFWSGCTKVSPGCAHCYAEALSDRNTGNIGKWGRGAPRRLHESAFKLAEKLNRRPWISDVTGNAFLNDDVKPPPADFQKGFHRRRIFSNSLADWLDDEVPIGWLVRMLDTIRRCEDVTWILCTKRPENFFKRIIAAMDSAETTGYEDVDSPLWEWLGHWNCGARAPKNIIVMVSVENQEMADARIPELLKIPAACRALSVEPLLGPIDLSKWSDDCNGVPRDMPFDWIIIGGESGRNARRCNVNWIRSIMRESHWAGAATFVKQLGDNPSMDREDHQIIRSRKGGDLAEWPADLRVQEFPE